MEPTELVEPAEPVEPINQKEYLKKYLSGKDKKKKRKKKPAIGDRVKIIDDDIDISHLSSIDEAVDLLNTNEDAPQIVGVIDDRPMHLRIDDYRKSDLWKPLGAQDNATNDRSVDRTLLNNQDSSPPRVKLHIGSSSKHSSEKARRRDESPPRRRDKSGGKSRWSDNVQIRRDDEYDSVKQKRIKANSPPRRNYKAESSSPSDSPPRRIRTADGRDSSRSSPQRRRHSRSDDDNSPLQRSDRDSDNSPPRKTNKDNSPPRRSKRSPSSSSPRRRDFDSSPPRRNRRDSDSPLRQRNKREDDSSPPRRRKRNHDSPPRKRRDSDSSPSRQRNKRDDDSSSPKRNYGSSCQWSKKDSDSSPPRQKSRRNEDSSPSRRSRRNSDSSPPRRQLSKRGGDDSSPQRRIMKEYDGKTVKDDNRPSGSGSFKPPTEPQRKLLPGDKKGKYLIPAKRMAKTLDGKTAGLQSAQELVKENEEFRKREDDLFKNMSSDVSGANAAAIMRDRKTGKVRDLQKEAEEKREKEKQEAENKEKYSRWGRGLKQVEDYRDKLEQDLHEMNKPLARYADDEDLEKYLKEQEREGDPMLDYIRKKKKKKIVESGKPLKPQYEGEFMPNRFAIVPGYRWDGVDRSNGYEKKWFQVQNAKRAQQEEIYKWSTEDM